MKKGCLFVKFISFSTKSFFFHSLADSLECIKFFHYHNKFLHSFFNRNFHCFTGFGSTCDHIDIFLFRISYRFGKIGRYDEEDRIAFFIIRFIYISAKCPQTFKPFGRSRKARIRQLPDIPKVCVSLFHQDHLF